MPQATLSAERPAAAVGLEPPRPEDVGRLTRRGSAWSVLLVATRQVAGMGATVVLSRLLTPGDYGLLGMALTLTAFFQAFADLGLSWAAIRRHDLTRGQVDNLFWINALAGLLLWAGCVAAAPGIAAFYGHRELVGLVGVLGACFAFSGLAAQPLALLTRQLRFRSLFLVEGLAVLAGAAVGILLALRGFGVWALVGQILGGQAVRMVLGLILSGYRPGPPRSGTGSAALVKFGGLVTAGGLATYFARNADNVLIGRLFGPEQLGLYSRAYFLMSLPTLFTAGAMAPVIISSLSAIRGDRDRLGRAYRAAVRLFALIGMPLAGGLCVSAPGLVRLVYGPGWDESAALLRWLSIAAIAQTVTNSSGWLYIVEGRGRVLFLVSLLAAAVQVVAFAAGACWGTRGVAAAYSLSNLLLCVPMLAMAHRVASLSLAETFHAVRPALALTAAVIAAASAAGAAAGRLAGEDWAWRLAAEVAAGLLVVSLGGPRLASLIRRAWREL